MGQPIQFIITGDVLVDGLLATVEDAASRFHDVTSWDDDDYGGSESPRSRIEAEAHRVADEIEKLHAELTALRAKAAAGRKLRDGISLSNHDTTWEAAMDYDAAVGVE